MFCNQCGKKYDDDANFCPYCGAPNVNKRSSASSGHARRTGDDRTKEDSSARGNDDAGARRPYEGQRRADADSHPDRMSSQRRADADYRSDRLSSQRRSEPYYHPDRTSHGYQGKRVNPSRKRSRRKSPWKKFIPLLCVIGIMLAALLVLGIVRKNAPINLDMTDYYSVTFDGYDGQGRAESTLDGDKLFKDFEDGMLRTGQIKKSDLFDSLDDFNNAPTSLLSTSKLYLVYSLMTSEVDEELDPSDGLSNGDSVTLNVSVADNDELSAYHINLSGGEKSYKVQGLQEVEKYDAFADSLVQVAFSGTDGAGTADVKAPGESKYGVSYSLDKSSGLSNGDVVTLTVSPDSSYDFDEDYLSRYGKIPKETTKEYKVSGLNEYVKKVSDISSDWLQKMQKEAEDQIRAYAGNEWSDTASLSDMEYEGMYLLSAKDMDSMSMAWSPSYNRLYLVYKVDCRIDDEDRGLQEDVTDYICVMFENIVKLSDGSLSVDLNDNDLPDHTFEESSGHYYFRGFDSMDSLFNNVVVKKMDDYSYDTTFSDEQGNGSESEEAVSSVS